MAELLTRISLRYDSFEAWTNSTVEGQGANLKLNKGEVGICSIPAGTTAEGIQNPPHIMFKVGDGVNVFSALPWTSAKAADVHSWAKQDEATFKTWVKSLVDVGDIDLSGYYKKNEVDGLLSTNSTNDQKYAKDYADALIAVCNVTDTAVDGQYVSAVSQANGKITVSRANLPTYTLTTGATNGTVKFNDSEVAVAGLGSAAYKAENAFATAAQGQKADTAVQSVAEGTANGTVSVDGTNIAVHGLKSAAYTESSAYATSAQGALADTALQKADITTGSANGTIAVEGADVAVKGLGSAAYTASTAYDAAGAAQDVQDNLDEYIESNDAAVKAAKDIADANKATLDAFFNENAVSDTVVNTLKEIQEQLDAGDTSAANILAEVNKIKDGSTTVPNATNAASAADAAKLGGTVAANYALKSDLTGGSVVAAKATVAETANSLAETAKAEVKAVKVDNAANADKAADADKLGGAVAADYLKKADAPGYDDILTQTAASSAYQPKGNYATSAQGAKADTAVQSVAIATGSANGKVKLTVDGTATEADVYGLKSAAYTEASAYATSAQGAKADTAIQGLTGTNGITISEDANHEVTVGISNTEIFVINCGTASTVI